MEHHLKETLDEPKLRDILSHNWQVILKSVKAIKAKEKLRNLQIEGDSEDMKVNAVHDPDLDPFTVKFIIETSAIT